MSERCPVCKVKYLDGCIAPAFMHGTYETMCAVCYLEKAWELHGIVLPYTGK